MTDITQIIKTAQEEIEAANQRMKTAVSNALGPWMQEMITRFPKLKTITWQQYTINFNDGDACYFNVYNDDSYCVRINGCQLDDWPAENDDDEAIDRDLLGISEEEATQIFEAYSKLFGEIPQDIYLQLWGDHQEVTIDFVAKTITTEDYYDHD